MLEPNDQREGIATQRYRSRVSDVQLAQEAREKASETTGRIYTQNARLLVSVPLLALLLAGSVAGNIVQGLHGVRIEPYVQLVDHLGNQAPVLKLKDLSVTPEETQIMGILQHWIFWQRVLGDDPVATAQNWEAADLYTSNAARKQLEDYRREQKLRQQDQHRRVEVHNVRVRPIPKSRSYLVFWDELVRDESGREVRDESGRWEATLTIGDFQSQAVKEHRKARLQKQDWRNLLGILVDGISWKGAPMYLGFQPPPGQ